MWAKFLIARRVIRAHFTSAGPGPGIKNSAKASDWAASDRPAPAGMVGQGVLRECLLDPGVTEEIAVNLEGPVHRSMLLVPHLRTQERPVIANVSSGLAFVPIAAMPIYCATKAALHSFTLSLRHQLSAVGIEVVEIVPPAVRTNLGGSHDFGTPLAEYADAVMAQLAEGRPETTYDISTRASQASRAELDGMFEFLDKR